MMTKHAISGGQMPPSWDYGKIKDTNIKRSKNNSLIQHRPDITLVLGPENLEIHKTELCSWNIQSDGRTDYNVGWIQGEG